MHNWQHKTHRKTICYNNTPISIRMNEVNGLNQQDAVWLYLPTKRNDHLLRVMFFYYLTILLYLHFAMEGKYELFRFVHVLLIFLCENISLWQEFHKNFTNTNSQSNAWLCTLYKDFLSDIINW